MHGSRNQKQEVQGVLLTITATDSHWEFVLPILATLDSTDLEILVCKGKNSSSRRPSNSPVEL